MAKMACKIKDICEMVLNVSSAMRLPSERKRESVYQQIDAEMRRSQVSPSLMPALMVDASSLTLSVYVHLSISLFSQSAQFHLLAFSFIVHFLFFSLDTFPLSLFPPCADQGQRFSDSEFRIIIWPVDELDVWMAMLFGPR